MMTPNSLTYYQQHWTLTDPQLLVETHTSHIYTVSYNDARVILKLLKPHALEEANGAIALHYWNGHGAVRLLHADEQAHLLEYADGDDLIPMVKRGEDQQATVIIADVLNQLHADHTDFPDGITELKTWFRSLFLKAEADRTEGLDSLFVRAGRVAEALFDTERDVRVLHGDIHHENVRYCAGRGWLAFDPKGLIGERAYDAANTLCNPLDMHGLVENEKRLLTNAAILAQRMGIKLQRVLAFTYAYASLSASWYVEDGVYPAHEYKIAEIVEPHVSV